MDATTDSNWEEIKHSGSPGRTIAAFLAVAGFCLVLPTLKIHPLLSLAAWTVCVIGTVYTVWSFLQTRKWKRPIHGHVIVASLVLGFVGATVLIVDVYLALDDAMVRMVSGENLKGMANGLHLYCEKHGEYPSTLQQIMEAGMACDEAAAARIRSSYVYVPGQGALVGGKGVMVVYEREPFCPRWLLPIRPQRRYVMYEDGYSECLTEEGFRVALNKDRQRRRELGWLTTQTAPSE